jgi:D-alanyl-D-alanine carboxypeptidase
VSLGVAKWLPIVVMAWGTEALAIDQAALTALLDHARTQMEMPGVRAAVRLADGRVVRATVGLADVEANVPLNDTVGMPGGSTGKTFVAALTMLLVEDGTLSLDDPASKWLGNTSWYGELPNADTIQVRHLLSHTAGVADYPGTLRYQLGSVWRALTRGSIAFERDELIGFVLDRKPLFQVGEGYRYTDAGYLVLGKLIEAASGRSYYDLLEERILTPQRLDQVHAVRQSIIPNVPAGYSYGARNLNDEGRMKFDPTSEWTGGGLTLNPTMLVQFHAGLAERRVVSSASFRQMLDAGWRDPEAPGSHYGFGLFVDDGGEWFGHGGLWPGYRTHVTHFVPTGVTVAVQTNRDGDLDMVGLVERIAALAR